MPMLCITLHDFCEMASAAAVFRLQSGLCLPMAPVLLQPATYVRGAFFLSFRAYIHSCVDAMGPHCCARSTSINTAMKGLCRNRRAAKEIL